MPLQIKYLSIILIVTISIFAAFYLIHRPENVPSIKGYYIDVSTTSRDSENIPHNFLYNEYSITSDLLIAYINEVAHSRFCKLKVPGTLRVISPYNSQLCFICLRQIVYM